MKRVVIADDHPLFRAALAQTLRRIAPDAELIEAPSAEAAATALAEGADLLLLDLHMADSAGFGFLLSVKHDRPDLPVVVVSGSEDPSVPRRAEAFGASGFIPKSSDPQLIAEALSAVRDGDLWFPIAPEETHPIEAALASLTPAQLRVLQGICEGRLNKQIAYDMGITEATVKAHVTAVLRKLNVLNRTQAVLAAQPLIVDPPVIETAS